MFIPGIVFVIEFFLGNLCFNTVVGRTCILDNQGTFSRPCGGCGVCKTTLKSQHLGICDGHYLETSGLFLETQRSHCVLKNYCENYTNLCKNDSQRFTGVCFPIFGTYICECKRGFFGKDCENADDFQLSYKTINYDKKRTKHLAVVNNVVFTPIFYCLDFATILISLQNTGFNLSVYIDNGRENLHYNEHKCEKTYSTATFCKSLFSEVENIRICEGKYLQKHNQLRNEGCLITVKVPFPRTYDKSRVVYKYTNEVRSSNNPVLGNLETITVGVKNNFGKYVNKQVFKYTFNLINVHRTFDPRTDCAPKIRLINCGASMEEMPRISQYTDLIILQSVTTDYSVPICQEFRKFKSFWKVWRVQENHDELNDIPLLKMINTKTYAPNTKKLEYGIYKVQLTVVSNLLDFIVSEIAYCYFEVIRTPIQTIILGGSMKTIYYKKPIIADVFSSVIPDRHILDKGMKIAYNWHCNDLKEKFCKPFVTTDTTRKIRGPFHDSKTYSFIVNTMVNNNKFGIVMVHPEKQVIKVTSSEVSHLAIVCSKNCGGSVFKSNPQEFIILEVSTRQLLNENETIIWKYKCVEDNTDFQDVGMIKSRDSTKIKLLIERNALKEARKYVFHVSLVGSVSYAEILIETDQTPKGVFCEVFPKSGTKGETMFNVSCKSVIKEERFPSLTYEFYDRYEHESIGRIVGYSTTGVLAQVILTRDTFVVRATNFFGTAMEIYINVTLSSPEKLLSPSSILDFENELKNKDYICQLGLISARSDLSPSRLFWSDEMQILLNHLSEEEAQPQDIMGALMLKNVLFITACDKFIAINKETTIFQCESILSVAKIMHEVTNRMQGILHRNNTNLRILSTVRTKIFVDSILECSNFVLMANFLTERINSDFDVHECLKKSTYYTIDTLDDLVFIVALQMPLLTRQTFEAENVAVFVEELRPHMDESVMITSLDFTKIGIQKDFKYYIQKIIFNRNPYWWGSGSKINTNVYSFQLNSGNRHIQNPKIGGIVHFRFKVNKFQPLLTQGSVKQPDPKKKPQVNDFEVAVYRLIPETHSETFIEFVNFTREADITVLILHGERPDFDLMRSKAIEVTMLKRKWSFGLKGRKNSSFYYLGILPGPHLSLGMSVKYSFTLYSARCAVWKYRSWISGEKCAVNKSSSDINRQLLVCSCTPPLTIGGYVYVPIVSLNPFSDLPLFLEISENTVSISLLLINFLLFSIILIWTKKKDKEDMKRKVVLVFEDNRINYPFLYLIAMFTGSRFGAGTTSTVGIKLFGEKAMSRTHVFSSSQQPILQCGGDDWFILTTPQHLGSLLKIKLLIDYSGLFPIWFCRKVMVCDLQNYETRTFIVEKWFGIFMNGVRMELVKKGATSQQVNTFRLIFFHNLIQGFREFHIYLSIFFKHPRSLINRTQRLTVSLCCVLVAMVTTTLFYSLSTPIFEDYAVYQINFNTFVISLISSLAAAVIHLTIMRYFRKSYTIVGNKFLTQSEISLSNKFKHKSNEKPRSFCLKLLYKYTEKYVSSCKIIPIGNIDNTMDLEENRSIKNLAWLICLAVIFVSVYIIIMSSLTYGEIKRSIWLTSLMFSGLITFFILIPIKVFLTAVLVSLLRIRYFDLMSHNIQVNKFLEYVKSKKYMKVSEKEKYVHEVHSYIFWHAHCCDRVKKNHYKTIRIFISFYILEALILIGIIVWAMEDFETYKQFYANTAICNEMMTVEKCANIIDMDISFNTLRFHVHEYMLPKLFYTKWYNGRDISSKEELNPETGWMRDANSRVIGDPHLIQVRVQRSLCQVPKMMINFTRVCLPPLTSSTADRENYGLSWTHDDWTEIDLFSESPWEFLQGSGIGVRTPSDYYLREGGYIATLLRTLGEAELVYRNLIDTNWIDDLTRVIVLEFVTYNVNNNMISSSYFVTETFPTHVIRISYTIRSESRDYYTVSMKSKLFIFFSLYFLVRTLVLINIMGVGNFFESFWNCFDVFFSILYIVASVKYIYLLYLSSTNEAKAEAMEKNRHIYLEILFQARQAVIIYICYTFGAAATRLIRIARINDSCKKYVSNFIDSRTELVLTLTLSFSSMYIMFRLVMYYLEPPTVYDFMDILVLQSDFQSLEDQYDSFTGKFSAYILGCLSDITMFSFTISLLHHQRQIILRRLSLIGT